MSGEAQMLRLIESLNEKVDAYEKLEARLKEAWRNAERRVVVWRPDSREMTIYHNGTYWFGSIPPNEKDATPRYWNPFGEYRETGNLQIAVEINVPTKLNERRVSGFFARDLEAGIAYLMHDGGLGGGRKGIGRSAFLAWSSAQPVPAIDAAGDSRLGIVIAPADSRSTAGDVARFVKSAIDFKQAVMSGETESPQARQEQRTYEDYYNEFVGKKRRRRLEEVEYISRHGDVVRALCDWRRRGARSNEKVVKNAYIDLGIARAGVLTELYEVKTNGARQTLYSAIGQLVVHDDSKDGGCRRFLVLPASDSIPDDISRTLRRSNISVVRFEFRGEKVLIRGE